MVKVNKARGDVPLEIGGEKYVLRGTFENLAAYQAALDVVGLGTALEMVANLDARALLEGIRCLAIDGDTNALGDMPFLAVMNDAQEAIISALTGDMGQDEGNAVSETKAGL